MRDQQREAIYALEKEMAKSGVERTQFTEPRHDDLGWVRNWAQRALAGNNVY
ncbi:hypothetical protein CBOM_05486 [Ceraceosorus bombacis]|uniref:Uncharacterized protein n=1 Tax=Ceraceosorus bombacis TaxID=401625 RepID=A0A0P1BS05_9BASI|nr:hypothetical protein CBOM_05486 [Ceraceosorus bombacis]